MGFFSDGFLGGLVEGVLGDALGGAVNGGINSAFAQKQAEMQAKLQRENWEYAQKNAHQFEVQDLRAAGLNPILSATNSQAIGMPGAPSGSIDTKSNVNSAVAAKRQYEVAKLNAETEKDKAASLRLEQENRKEEIDNNKRLIEALIPVHNATAGKLSAETQQVFQDIANSIRLTHAQISAIDSKKRVDEATVFLMASQAKEAISASELNNQQKVAVKADVDSYVRKLLNLTAEERYNVLLAGTKGENSFGIINKFGYLVDVLNPFGSIGTTLGSIRVGNHK